MTSSSKQPPGEILLLLSDPRARAALAGALEPPHRIRVLQTPDEVPQISADLPPIACIFDTLDLGAPFPPYWLSALKERHPYLALLVASDFSGNELDLYSLGRASLDRVIRWDLHPSPREILATLEEAVCTGLARGVLSEMGDDLPPLARNALTWTIEHALERPQVSELASALRLSPTSLARGLSKAKVVPPRSLLLWGRLVLASHLLARRDETVESVAFRLGYATGGTLGKAMKTHLGCSPTELLRRGALTWTSKALREGIAGPTGGKEV